MAEPLKLDSKNALLRKLVGALGLTAYKVASIEIRAAVNAFPMAKVEFAIPEPYVEAVAKAVGDHREDLVRADVEPSPVPPDDTIAVLNRHEHGGRDDWASAGDAVYSAKGGMLMSWEQATSVAGKYRASGDAPRRGHD